MKPIKTIFVGTSIEGISTLETLNKNPKHSIVAVITQPDKPIGRKQKLNPTPINKIAKELSLKVYTPNKKNDFLKICESENPELIIVISYGKILPKRFIEYPKYKTLNVHYSLLPKLRGAIPVQKAIMDGNNETGVSIQIMRPTLDSGPIVAQKKLQILDTDTTESLKSRLIPLGQSLIMDTIPKWISGQIKPVEQEEKKATFCFEKELAKENAQIDFTHDSPEQIERKIRAFTPWPIAWTILPNEKRLKLYQAQIVEKKTDKSPGEIKFEESRMFFATLDPQMSIEPLVVQLEGKTKMETAAFLQGYRANN